MWDEFDDFFDFNDTTNQHSMKDETKGTDYKADVAISFMDAFKGVKTVRNLFSDLDLVR